MSIQRKLVAFASSSTPAGALRVLSYVRGMTAAITRNFDAQATAELLNYSSLVRVLQQVILEYGAGKIVSPEHMVVPMQEGGLMLSMPASVRPVTWLRAASPVRR